MVSNLMIGSIHLWDRNSAKYIQHVLLANGGLPFIIRSLAWNPHSKRASVMELIAACDDGHLREVHIALNRQSAMSSDIVPGLDQVSEDISTRNLFLAGDSRVFKAGVLSHGTLEAIEGLFDANGAVKDDLLRYIEEDIGEKIGRQPMTVIAAGPDSETSLESLSASVAHIVKLTLAIKYDNRPWGGIALSYAIYVWIGEGRGSDSQSNLVMDLKSQFEKWPHTDIETRTLLLWVDSITHRPRKLPYTAVRAAQKFYKDVYEDTVKIPVNEISDIAFAQIFLAYSNEIKEYSLSLIPHIFLVKDEDSHAISRSIMSQKQLEKSLGHGTNKYDAPSPYTLPKLTIHSSSHPIYPPTGANVFEPPKDGRVLPTVVEAPTFFIPSYPRGLRNMKAFSPTL
jgi:hypothetical protein